MNWSEMLPEILDIIAKKHNLYHEDYVCFAGVCKSWCLAAVRATNKDHYPNGLPSHIPCLLLLDEKQGNNWKRYYFFNTEKKEDDDDLQLFCPLNKNIRKISLSEGRGRLYISSGGWLLTIGHENVPKLINPFSREIIYLPNICTFPESRISSNRDDIHFRKLVLVESSLVVVLLYGCRVKLKFCRCKDEKWTSIFDSQDTMLLDITYHKGHIYNISYDYQIKACDVSQGNPTTIVTVSTLPEYLYCRSFEKYIFRAYVIGLKDDNGLLVIIREVALGTTVYNESPYKTTSFRVFKYDLDSEEWSQVKNLGRKSLFVGYGQSFSMEEDSKGVIMGNCIYFTDDFEDLSGVGGGSDMGVYHMSSQTVEQRFHGESHSHFTLPIWIQPAI
ncbi:putative F-box protein At5g55150 [Rutidosis leptorrhynchoides]|uniref:putative F-box protein At5g55150 n=1 Tax=Rutidosis leptorrhynchoides TaxID=125765 RepID=UPI003A998C1C